MNKTINIAMTWTLGIVTACAMEDSFDSSPQTPIAPPQAVASRLASDSDALQNAIADIRQADTLNTLNDTIKNLRISLACPELGIMMFDTDINRYPHLDTVREALFDQMCRIQQRGKYRPGITTNTYNYVAQSGWLGMFYGFHLVLQELFNTEKS